VVDGGHITNDCGEFWQGVEVWGQKNVPQNILTHGVVEVTNGGTISNARVGVDVMKRTPVDDWSQTGGIVWVNEANFINNKTDIGFMPSANYDAQGNKTRNSSFIRNSLFETNQEYIGGALNENAIYHISIYRNDGVGIYNNTFSYVSQLVDEKVGKGITSIEAGYTVNPENSAGSGNTFMNLDYGIHATGILDPLFPVIIESNYFENCQRGIYWNTIVGHNVIWGNEIYTPLHDLREESPYGIYLYKSTDYIVEDNVLEGDWYAGSTEFNAGIVVVSGGDAPNEIFSNDISGYNVALESIGINRDLSGDNGLQFLCNDISDNLLDIYIRPFKQSPEENIRREQGSPTPISSANLAGNLFSPLLNNPDWDHFENRGMELIIYNHHDLIFDPSSNPRLEPESAEILLIQKQPLGFSENPNDCNSQHDPYYLRNISYGANPYLLNDSVNYYSQILSDVDFGNSDSLISAISNWSSPYLFVYQDLSAQSPYFSNNFLDSMFRSNLPDIFKIGLGLQNPHFLIRKGTNELVLNNTNLSQGLWTVISSNSYWDQYIEESSRYGMHKTEQMNRVKDRLAYFSYFGEADSIKQYVSDFHLIPNHLWGINQALESQEFAQAQNLVNYNLDSLNLGMNEIWMNEMMTYYTDICLDTVSDFDQKMIQLDSLSTEFESPAKYYANNIYGFFNDTDTTYDPVFFPDDPLPEPKSTDVVNVAEEKPDFIVSPNPFDKYVSVLSKFTDIKQVYLLDLRGAIILSREVDGRSVVIPTEELSSGSYILFIEGEYAESETYIIVKP
jgi:hypothetical protein